MPGRDPYSVLRANILYMCMNSVTSVSFYFFLKGQKEDISHLLLHSSNVDNGLGEAKQWSGAIN